MENIKNKTKCVFNMGVARELLRNGATIVDLKPDRNNPDKTIPVFKRDEAFEAAFTEINKTLQEKKLQQNQ